MSRCAIPATRWFGRLGVGLVLLVASGCIQRGAPVDTPRGSPPPRAAQPWDQQVRPAPVYPAPLGVPPSRGSTPFPSLPNDQALPPPNVSPVVRNVGTPSPVPYSPVPRPRGSDNSDFEPIDFSDGGVTEEPLAPVGYTAPPRQSQPRASDDYATLLGEDGKNSDSAEGRSPGDEEGSDGEPDERNAGTEGAAVGAGGKVLVALLVPESDRRGSVRNLADGLAKAASLAASDFNEPRLVLRKYDTAGDPRKAAEAAKNAISDGAQLIIGPLFSGSAAAVRPVAQAADISVIAFTTDESVLGGGLYSIGFLPKTEIERIISYAGSQGKRNIAVLAPDSPYGAVITRNAQAAAGRSGASIVRVQPFQEDFRSMDVTATDFAKYYDSAPNVDALLMPTNGRTLGALSAYLAYRDVLPTKVKFMGLGLWDDKETFREATLRNGWFPGVDPALKTDFAYRYGQAYGGEPPSIAFLGYDAVAVAASLLDQSGGSDPFARQSILSRSGFSGMSGLFRFRSDGGNDRALSILSVQQQDFKVIDPAPSSFSQQVTSLTGG